MTRHSEVTTAIEEKQKEKDMKAFRPRSRWLSYFSNDEWFYGLSKFEENLPTNEEC